MNDGNETRVMVLMRREQIKLCECFFNKMLKDGIDPRFIGRRISDIYTENKNSKTRKILCNVFSRMNPEELKYLIYYLRYRHHEKHVLFYSNERSSIAKLILEQVDEAGGDFVMYRNTLRDSFTDITAPFEVYSKDFRPY